MSEPINQATELAAVLGDECEAVMLSGGRAVDVTPLRLKQFSDVLKCVGELGDVITTTGFDALKFLAAGDVAIKLLAIATGLETEVLEKLELDEAAALAGAVYRVNKSFFEKKGDAILAALGIAPELVQTLKESLSGLVTKAEPATEPGGPESSSSSSPTVTTSTTSQN